ncbi:MAG: DUF3817 domain-containing protein [Neisseriaceae bacterium]|nr:DUF3817 domain-containing protein [Neisseriaceae bacterium]MBP6862128.1 DUF3817 domain-containing protein [Neisseriaceae bacterium]
MAVSVPPKFLHVSALLEGASLLILLFIGLPLKYGFGVYQFNQWMGPLHGGLFLLYLFALLVALLARRFSLRWAPLAVLCAFLPGGTFWLMHRMGK